MSPFFVHLLFLCCFCSTFPRPGLCKSTIEPCAGSDACRALVGYTLYADLKVSEVAALFQVDPVALLTANAVDVSFPDVENHILPAGLFLRVPVACACADGIRKSLSVRYRARPADTLASIAASVYSGLVSADQIREANGISDPGAVDAGRSLLVPLPCTCFNSSDNMLPAVYMSYVVRDGDTVPGIAAAYSTTVTDIMNVNAMGSPSVKPGDILAIPLPACASAFPKYSSDYGLIVANGSYAITASHCVQCSCGPGNLNLYCTPSSLAASCSSMQCKNSNLMLGNITSQSTSAGCNVTSCTYGGLINETIVTTLSMSLQPLCPGQHQFPPLIPPPSALIQDPFLAPSPSPSHSGRIGTRIPKSSVPATLTPSGLSPANGPAGSISGNISEAHSLVNALPGLPHVIILCVLFKFLL
uniref:LysM domain-containing GPI-anchored protein 1 n=1 Tax=Anthurium amnicola TaxID=1678845 RepID=A0A1D1Y975_9ARAE